MANQEHINLVMQGAEAVEEWRKNNPDTVLDLGEANLRRADFVKINLNDANLKNSNLEWADFRWADLMNTNFEGSNLSRADFHKADLESSNLKRTNLKNTNFEDANLTKADVSESTFSNTRLLNTDFTETIGLYSANHTGTSFIDMETFYKVAGQLPPEFFRNRIFFSPPESPDNISANLLYQFEGTKKSEFPKIDETRVWLIDVEEEMIKYFRDHPEKMREMNPRKFEEFVASIFKNQGFNVALTPQTRDGGYDIFAVKHDKFTGNHHYLIECKRYAEHNKVDVGIVRSLLGVLQMNNATKGIIATTSFFTKDARDFALNSSSRLILHDYDSIRGLLAEI